MDDDVAVLKDLGVTLVVSILTPTELVDMHVTHLSKTYVKQSSKLIKTESKQEE